MTLQASGADHRFSWSAKHAFRGAGLCPATSARDVYVVAQRAENQAVAYCFGPITGPIPIC